MNLSVWSYIHERLVQEKLGIDAGIIIFHEILITRKNSFHCLIARAKEFFSVKPILRNSVHTYKKIYLFSFNFW